MFSLQQLLKACHAILLLVVCLQLETNNAQTATPSALSMTVDMPKSVKANEEMTVKLTVISQLQECMVMKTYLKSTVPQDGPMNYKYTACLCAQPRNFYWDFAVNQTMQIASVVDIVVDKGICPEDKAVVPITANRFVIQRYLTVN